VKAMATSAYEAIAVKLATGDLVILDGGTGTDIQRRGVPMHGETWCAEANRTHPEVIQAVHADYIRAGAQVITANTFATSPVLFDALGRASEIAVIDARAVALAKRARDDAVRETEAAPIAVAGSFSTMRLLKQGSDRESTAKPWSRAQTLELMRVKADALAAAGADLIIMEMMRDTDYSVWATEAALATGLPVWVGISLETKATGKLTGYSRPDQPAEDIITALSALKPHAMAIMHTSVADTDLALPMARAAFAGPLGVYPESGHFKMPDWQFADLTPEEFVIACRRWRAAGVAMLGGCCGIGPAHIEALSRAAPGMANLNVRSS
jgi:S-methylmethionine-dependent homocysteine/selenocysteine methylase